jgi:hypothetical protein
MKHQNPKGRDRRSDETKERDREAAACDHASHDSGQVAVNTDGGAEGVHSGRNSARSAAETRRTDRR